MKPLIKIRHRLLSPLMHRGFDTMIKLYCGDTRDPERNTFADMLVKQMNAGYRIAVYDINKLKS